MALHALSTLTAVLLGEVFALIVKKSRPNSPP